jgi:hypothetical protein
MGKSIAIGEFRSEYKKAKYKFLKDYKDFAKKGQILEGTEMPGRKPLPGSGAKFASQPATIMFVLGGDSVFHVLQSEIGKTIEKVADNKAPTNTGGTGTTTDTTTTQTQSGLFTTKNIVIGVIVLAVAYYGYKKYVKKGKK